MYRHHRLGDHRESPTVALIGEGPSKLAPGVPTFREAGVDLTILNWGGLLGPAKMPAAVKTRLANEVARILALPDMREKLNQFGAEAIASTPEDFAAFTKAEHDKFAKLVKAAGIQAE